MIVQSLLVMRMIGSNFDCWRYEQNCCADISDRGLVLAGGGALLRNLDKRIRDETGFPVCVADDPLCSVVLGTAKLLDDFKLLRRVAVD
jgi:rod shape-determining protein MreB and related proteins